MTRRFYLLILISFIVAIVLPYFYLRFKIALLNLFLISLYLHTLFFYCSYVCLLVF